MRKIPGRTLSEFSQKLTAEYSYQNKHSPDCIRIGYTREVLWKCPTGKHDWLATISFRRKNPQMSCRTCARHPTSSQREADLRDWFRQEEIITDIAYGHNTVLKISAGKVPTMTVDIVGTYQGYPVAFEYDSSKYHNQAVSLDRDTRKTQALLDAGYVVIRARGITPYSILPEINITHPLFFQYNIPDDLQNYNSRKVREQAYMFLKTLPEYVEPVIVEPVRDIPEEPTVSQVHPIRRETWLTHIMTRKVSSAQKAK